MNLTAQVTYVSSADPAVDWDRIVDAELELDQDLKNDPKTSHDEKKEICERRFMQKYHPAVMKNPAAWADLLKFKSGEQPTKFHLGVIPPDEVARISDECRLGHPEAMREQAYWRAFLACLRGVENFGSEAPPKKRVGDVEYVDPVWTKSKFSRGLRPIALAAGMVGWAWNQLTEDEVKN